MHDQIDFTDDTVIVTGAARGIGRGVAEAFADHGAHVFFQAEDGIRDHS
ncbi:MAG: SDR family NAD(P)-dependent oxidoreductase [Salinirussus sp.]